MNSLYSFSFADLSDIAHLFSQVVRVQLVMLKMEQSVAKERYCDCYCACMLKLVIFNHAPCRYVRIKSVCLLRHWSVLWGKMILPVQEMG